MTKTFYKLESAISEDKVHTEEISSLLQTIDKKKTALAARDDQILNEIDTDGMTEEMLETDEYYYQIDA